MKTSDWVIYAAECEELSYVLVNNRNLLPYLMYSDGHSRIVEADALSTGFFLARWQQKGIELRFRMVILDTGSWNNRSYAYKDQSGESVLLLC